MTVLENKNLRIFLFEKITNKLANNKLILKRGWKVGITVLSSY